MRFFEPYFYRKAIAHGVRVGVDFYLDTFGVFGIG
jgi:hypothetical protein